MAKAANTLRRLLPRGVRGRLVLTTTVVLALISVGIVVLTNLTLRSEVEQTLLEDNIEQTAEVLDFYEFEGPDLVNGLTEDLAVLLIEDRLVSDADLKGLAAATGGGPNHIALATSWETAALINLASGDIRTVSAEQIDGPVVIESTLYDIAFVFDDFDFSTNVSVLTNNSEKVFQLEDLTVVTWIDTTEIDSLLARFQTLLALLLPLIIVGGGALAWVLTSRALKPVRQMVGEVDAMDPTTLSRQVSTPKSGDEIEALGITLNEMLTRIESAVNAQRQFVADASHELRSPIAIIKHESEIALKYPDRVDQETLAEVANVEVNRLDRLVDDLLVLASMDSPATNNATMHAASNGSEIKTTRGTRCEAFADLDEAVFSETQRQRSIPVDTSNVSAGRIHARPDQLERIVRHLIDNACRHAANQVLVSVQTLKSTGRNVAVLVVDDDGSGIDPTERSRIFERFVRLDAARSRDKGGAGLGLAVVKATVEETNGTIEVDTNPSGGARFVVTWPIVDSPPSE